VSATPDMRTAPLVELARQLVGRYAGDLPRLRGELSAVRAEVRRVALAIEEADDDAAIARDLEAALHSAGLGALVTEGAVDSALETRLDHLAGLVALFELTGAA